MAERIMADTSIRTFRKAFKYRIYPTRTQIAKLDTWLDICRELHNAAIQERREAWKVGVSVNFASQSRQLPAIKEVRPEVAQVNAQVLQQALHRVDLAFKAFFRRIKAGQTPGYPRFKGRDRYDSLTWPQDIGFRLVGTKRVRLSGIGEVKIKLHRSLEGIPKTCTIKRKAGKWYAIFSCDEVPARCPCGRKACSGCEAKVADGEIGIDMGLESFAAFHTGEKVFNPRWYRKTEKKFAEAQRKLTSKQKKSNRRRKARERLARLHAKVANQRKDFQHKLARRIVSENKFIAIEDIEPKKMAERSSTGLSKSIQDAAWAQFLAILSDKAEEAGRTLVKVSPTGTSSTCFQCGAYQKKGLSEREHCCPCGLVLDRDVHAALNILRLGRSLRDSA
jgi:putative transposase